MTRFTRRLVVVLAATVAVLFLLAGSAWANLDSQPAKGILGSSRTNPSPPADAAEYADLWWRQGWGNSVMPQIYLNPPESMLPTVDGVIIGTLYTIDQAPGTSVNASNPQNYDFSTYGGTSFNVGPYGTNQAGTFDLLTVAINLSRPPEGTWYMHYKFVSTMRASSTTLHAQFNIDRTPPSQVSSVTISSDVSGPPVATSTSSTWTPSSRAVIKWQAGEQDVLSLVANSGVAYYQVLVDDQPFVPESTTTPVQGRVYSAPWLPHPSSITIENMPSGRHKVSVVAVDRATNRSVESTPVYFESDPDTPTITFTAPTGTLTPRSNAISVAASDAAGNPSVAFGITGGSLGTSMVTMATLTAPPYTITPNLTGLPAGAYSLVATATDSYGRTAVATHAVNFTPTSGYVGDSAVRIPIGQNIGTSLTNPGALDDVDTWWRQGWGNSLYPQFTLNTPVPPALADWVIAGILYGVTTSTADIDLTNPDAYYRSARGDGMNLDKVIDMQGVYKYPPATGWRSSPVPGATSAIEGPWYLNLVWITSQGTATDFTYHVPMGIDITPPSAVESLSVSPSHDPADATTTVLTTSRVEISWAPKQYDALAGVGYFQILFDGNSAIPDGPTKPTQGRVYDIQGVTPHGTTIENLPPGRHVISVAAVDRATNVGPSVSATITSDPDTPTIAFTSPLTNVLSKKTLFSVNATDMAGDPTVRFYFDSVATATITSPPYAFKPNLDGAPSGEHTITATVTDLAGRQVTISKQVSFSNSSVSSGFMIDGGPRLMEHASDYVSVSNPVTDRWRVDSNGLAWGNSLYPDFSLKLSPDATGFADNNEGDVVGMLYDVVRSPRLINQQDPESYFRSVRSLADKDSTHLDQTLDMASLMSYPPVGGWPTPTPGTEQPVEGVWALQYKAYTDGGWAESYTNYVPFGIDLTPPSAPLGLAASPTTGTAMSGATTAGTRMHFTWLTSDYDLLSGVAYYQVLLDGLKIVPDGADDQGRVIDIPDRIDPAVTLENLTAGRHTFSVEAVDRAGNVGEATSVVVYSDPDTPTISITSPSGSAIGVNPSIAATASDAGGVASVVFRLNGTVILTKTSAPYSGQVDLSAFASGDQTLTATVTDRLGRQVTTAKVVTLDRTALQISSVSASCSKRKLTLKFNVNRAATVTASLKIARTSKTLSSSGSGHYTFTYTYPKKNSRYPSPLSFKETYTLSALDSLGNSTSKSNKITIKIARLVKVGASGVKIVYY